MWPRFCEEWRRTCREYGVRFLIEAALIAVIVAFCVLQAHPRELGPNQWPGIERFMAAMCDEEAKLFRDRADGCRYLHAGRIAWDAAGQDFDAVRISPDAAEHPEIRSWPQQAAAWDRAAARAERRAAEYRRAADRLWQPDYPSAPRR